MNYGISYMGSKTGIAREIVDLLPRGKRFVDLFGGGFAISHYVLIHHIYNKQLSLFGKKWESLLYNDYDRLIVDVIKRAINGEFNYKRFKPKFITKEDFLEHRTKDGYIKSCWSFGNNGKSYMYSDTITPYKKACHQAIVFDEWEMMKELCPEVWEVAYKSIKDIKNIKKRRLGFAPPIVKKLKQIGDWDIVQNNPLYKSCHWRGGKLDGTHNDLQSLQSLESLEITCMSYEDYIYKEGDVVYCDIPYEATSEYSGGFDHKKFYDWAYTRPYQVFFSSYDNITDTRFKCIWKQPKRTSYGLSNSTVNNECVYLNKNT